MEPGLGVQLFEKVKAHMKWDDEKTKLWFDTPNPHFGGSSPRNLFKFRPEKCEKIIDALILESQPPTTEGA